MVDRRPRPAHQLLDPLGLVVQLAVRRCAASLELCGDGGLEPHERGLGRVEPLIERGLHVLGADVGVPREERRLRKQRVALFGGLGDAGGGDCCDRRADQRSTGRDEPWARRDAQGVASAGCGEGRQPAEHRASGARPDVARSNLRNEGNPASRGTETSAAVLVGPPGRMESSK
jgi:hypothetical protein